MMIQEFEQLTGIYTTMQMYGHIEKAYADFNGDKQEFCTAYKENRDGMAERIQAAANREFYKNETENEKTKKDLVDVIVKLKAENEKLKEIRIQLREKLEQRLKKQQEPTLVLSIKAKGNRFEISSGDAWKIMKALDAAAQVFNIDVDRAKAMKQIVEVDTGKTLRIENSEYIIERRGGEGK